MFWRGELTFIYRKMCLIKIAKYDTPVFTYIKDVSFGSIRAGLWYANQISGGYPPGELGRASSEYPGERENSKGNVGKVSTKLSVAHSSQVKRSHAVPVWSRGFFALNSRTP